MSSRFPSPFIIPVTIHLIRAVPFAPSRLLIFRSSNQSGKIATLQHLEVEMVGK